MNRFAIAMCMAMNILICHAQNTKTDHEEFDAFRSDMYRDFESFRTEIMRNYIEFIKNPWKDFESVPPTPKPKHEPIPPVIWPHEDKDTIQSNSNPIVIEEIIKPRPVAPQPQPVEVIPENDEDNECTVSISFYGTPMEIRYFNNVDYRIGKLSEIEVANALSILSTNQYDNCIYDCLRIRNEYELCDWAYLQFVKQISDKACGRMSNESTLLAAYILINSGYKIRLAYSDDILYMLYASDHCIFNKNSFFIDGNSYYGLVELPSHLMISEASFPKEQGISLLINHQPKFTLALSPKRMIVSKAFPVLKIEVQSNKNLLSFYETYPSSYYNENYMTQWAQYANVPMDSQIVASVYPKLKGMLEGLTEEEQVSRLLNWVQTGLEYEYDDKVWGHDRTFFSEETLFYPHCDCEDRSVLLTRLVRDLVGLECILIYYPGHLAMAVRFTTPLCGDYIDLNGKKYVVCDPTYIGAPIGMTMPGMKNSKAGVILLK